MNPCRFRTYVRWIVRKDTTRATHHVSELARKYISEIDAGHPNLGAPANRLVRLLDAWNRAGGSFSLDLRTKIL